MKSSQAAALETRWGVRNYSPLPIQLERGKGAWVWDSAGRRYLDFLSAYSALNQGHCHPKIAAAMKKQAGRLTLTSRAFRTASLGPLVRRLSILSGLDRTILMNSGAEGVETAIKAMRLWGHRAKGIREGRAEILVCEGNFHGRTTTIVGFSSDANSREGFGPPTPGFRSIPYGDSVSLEAAITPDTCGFLVEPIQGEAGVRLPPAGYLREVRRICSQKNVLFCADEVQTGLGRTGDMFAFQHEDARPDLLVLGKALSGGFYPVSAVCGIDAVLGLFTPGTHGSTFGGNPLACAVAEAALDVIEDEKLPSKAKSLGKKFKNLLRTLKDPRLKIVRGRGLLWGLEFDRPARPLCEILMKNGLLAKETHDCTVRLAPPLVIKEAELNRAISLLKKSLSSWK